MLVSFSTSKETSSTAFRRHAGGWRTKLPHDFNSDIVDGGAVAFKISLLRYGGSRSLEPLILPVAMGGEVCVVVFIGVLPVGAVIGDCDVGAVRLPLFAGVSTLPREVVELLLLPAFDPDCACAKPITPMNVAAKAVAISD